MAYNIIFTDTGERSYNECLDYLLYELNNIQAAKSFISDIELTIGRLASYPYAYSLCENQHLAIRNLRKIHLIHHSYKVFFSIHQEQVIIEYIIHDKRDYENILC